METTKHSSGETSIGEAMLHNIPTPLRRVLDGARPARKGEASQIIKDTATTYLADEKFKAVVPLIAIFVAVLLALAPAMSLFSAGRAVVPASSPIEPRVAATPVSAAEVSAVGRTPPSELQQPTFTATPGSAPEVAAIERTLPLEALSGSTATAPTADRLASAAEGLHDAGATQASIAPSEPFQSDANKTMPTSDIQVMWKQAQTFLQHSNCHESHKLFNRALGLLDDGMVNGHSERVLPTTRREALENDLAIAMICNSQFEMGAEILGRQGPETSSVHQNALGIAHFYLKDHRRAGAAFETALQVDPLNSIVWSNLAAAKLLGGDITAADDAMFRALDPELVRVHDDPRLNQIFAANVNIIAQHAIGQKSQQPLVELWYVPN